MAMRDKKRSFGGYGEAVNSKTDKHNRDCQRCGRTFKTNRVAAYCPACFTEKRREHKRWARGGA